MLLLLAFLLGAVQHSFLCDDAFISFRYARHLVNGEGLVWNAGERVEGYTNFLWVLLLAAGMALGVRPEVLAPVLGVACGAAVVALVAWLGVRRPAQAAGAGRQHGGWRDPLVWLAPAALALHPSFLAWSTGGLETQLFTLLTLAATAAFLGERRRGPAWPWRSPLLLALATLTRPEGALFAAVVGAVFLVDVLLHGRRWRPWLAWGLTYAAPVAVHLLWRHAYYGDWLPNTFHAKVNGFRWALGVDYLAYFFTSFQLHLLLPLALLAVLARRGLREALFSALLLADLLYLAAVGGDFLEFRFMVPLLPYLYLLLADGVRELARYGVESGSGKGGPSRAVRWSALPAALASALALLYFAAAPPRPWVAHPAGWESVDATRAFAADRQAQGLHLASLVRRGVLPPDLRLATGGLGAISYYTDWFVIDHHGLTDRHVARSPTTWTRLGHEHNVRVDYLARRRVAVVLLTQTLVAPDVHRLIAELPPAIHWLRSYNHDASAADRLRTMCLQPEPGAYMLFGTNLARGELRRQLGHLPPCPGVKDLMRPVPGGLPGEVELPLEVVPIPPAATESAPGSPGRSPRRRG